MGMTISICVTLTEIPGCNRIFENDETMTERGDIVERAIRDAIFGGGNPDSPDAWPHTITRTETGRRYLPRRD